MSRILRSESSNRSPRVQDGRPRSAADAELTAEDYRALAEFRYQIRRFLSFSEQAARAEGLEPQQHQMLLAIRALDPPDIGKLADYLMIRHHSAVGLIDRLEARGLVERRRNSPDRRRVHVVLTPEGDERLRRLSMKHRGELQRTLSDLIAGWSVGAAGDGLTLGDSKEENVSAARK